jgi:small GTP-binding protein
MSTTVKIIAIGDGAVGKTCLLVTYTTGQFPGDYIPTIFENLRCKDSENKTEYNIQHWDTAGQEQFANVRVFSYPDTDVFLVCFAINDRNSLKSVTAVWAEELSLFVKNPSVLLVGTKADTRGSARDCVTHAEGRAVAEKIGAFAYIECSALTNDRVKDVFDHAIVHAIGQLNTGCHCCTIQ